MYYPCSENKGADQLRGYREADLRLCFRICKKPVFSRRGSIAFYSLSFYRLFGCYEALDGGDLGEALEDFTGGVSEQLDIGELGLMDKPEERTAFYARLQKEVERKSLLAASIPVSYRKVPKFRDARNLCCYLPKVQTKRPTLEGILSKWCKWNSKQ